MKRYFCENCGKEVDESDELCRHCGAVFVAIKCPQCGFRGKQHVFHRGCPVCGFLGDENPVRYTESGQGTGPDSGAGGPPLYTSRSRDGSRRFARARKPVPDWVFWIVLASMVIAFIVLAMVYLRL